MVPALTVSLEREGWEVHQQVEAPTVSGPALEDDPVLSALASAEEQQAEILRRLQSVDAAHAEHKRALILYCSHIGGHKYAGNVIVSLRPTRAFRLLCARSTGSLTVWVLVVLSTDQHSPRGVDLVWAGHAARGGRDREGDDHRWEDPPRPAPRRDEPLQTWAEEPERLVAFNGIGYLPRFTDSHCRPFLTLTRIGSVLSHLNMGRLVENSSRSFHRSLAETAVVARGWIHDIGAEGP